VPQNVRGYINAEPSVPNCTLERLLDPFDWLSVPFDGEALPATMPAAQVSQKLERHGNGRLTLFCLSGARGTPIENTLIEINPTAAYGWAKSRATNRARACARIKRD
jgi:hypothetical protein